MKAQNLKQLMNEDENELLKDKSILKKSMDVLLDVVFYLSCMDLFISNCL